MSLPGSSKSQYVPAEYWSEVVHDGADLSAVGHPELGPYNLYAYERRLRAFDRALELAGVGIAGSRVFEAAYGVGFYLRHWRRHGAGQVAGVDISEGACRQAQTAFPDYDLACGDLAATDFEAAGKFDIVTGIDVLYHIVDDDRWAAALANLAVLVDGGGILVLSDKFPSATAVQTSSHVRRRPLDQWQQALAEHGLAVERLVPVFVLMDDPITMGAHPWLGRLSALQWRLAAGVLARARRCGWLHRTLARTVSWLQLPLEAGLLACLKRSPNLELIVARRT